MIVHIVLPVGAARALPGSVHRRGHRDARADAAGYLLCSADATKCDGSTPAVPFRTGKPHLLETTPRAFCRWRRALRSAWRASLATARWRCGFALEEWLADARCPADAGAVRFPRIWLSASLP